MSTYTPAYLDGSTGGKNWTTPVKLKFKVLCGSAKFQSKSLTWNTVPEPSPVKIWLQNMFSFIGNQGKVAHRGEADGNCHNKKHRQHRCHQFTLHGMFYKYTRDMYERPVRSCLPPRGNLDQIERSRPLITVAVGPFSKVSLCLMHTTDAYSCTPDCDFRHWHAKSLYRYKYAQQKSTKSQDVHWNEVTKVQIFSHIGRMEYWCVNG